jgi:outer membrane protein
MKHRFRRVSTRRLRRLSCRILAVLLSAGAFGGVLAAQEGMAAQEELAAGGELGLLETLEMALAGDPNIELARTDLAAARGGLEVARSAFDPALSSSLDQSRDSGAEPRTESLDAAAGATWLLRSGLQVSSALALARVAEDDDGEAANTGSLSVTLRQPLLRGRGRALATTAERIAEEELVATRDDLEQQVAGRLQVVASLYWSYLAAAENLAILRDTELQSRRFLDNTRRLVEADLTPAADLVQLEANLLSRQLAARAGERTLVEARQDLGREVGLEAAAILALPLPGDPYPALEPETAPPLAASFDYIDLAREHRADLRAARRRLEEARLRLRLVEDALKPRLDLLFTPSYSNTLPGDSAGDFFSPLYRDVPGLAATLGLAWSFSPPNRLARGNLEIQQAAVRQSELALRQVELQIGADLPAVLDEVSFNAEQLARSLEALELFRLALDNEEKKLRAGSSTLIDVLGQQNQLIAARQQVNNSRLSLALALLRLRFETGTLIESPGPGGEPARIALASFLTLPQLSR